MDSIAANTFESATYRGHGGHAVRQPATGSLIMPDQPRESVRGLDKDASFAVVDPLAGRTDAREVFLEPGDYFVGDERFVVRTMLGSCVSVVLWHPQLRFGAMSHFLLPRRGSSDASDGLSGKYGDEVMSLMITALKGAGITPGECNAKIFGGGNMFPDFLKENHVHIGRKNAMAARALLTAHTVPLVAEDMLGVGHRSLIFEVRTGDVWVRHTQDLA